MMLNPFTPVYAAFVSLMKMPFQPLFTGDFACQGRSPVRFKNKMRKNVPKDASYEKALHKLTLM